MTSHAILALLPLAAGRDESASDIGGVLIVVGIALGAALLAAAALFLLLRRRRSHRAAEAGGRNVERPLPSEEGRPWSSER